jgi:DTW domain-containing protein YfiP
LKICYLREMHDLAEILTDLDYQRCLGCFRPHRDCHCAEIPRIDNQTEVLILQHRRERFHPFNTVRMVHKALRNSSLLVDHTPGLAARLQLKPNAGLLYPGPEAELLTDVPATDRPQQLVIIDGTWHHAKTMVRDIPALRNLPRYRIAPAEPSRYRIRREPSDLFLSTVEATVAALRDLEPDTQGLDQLLTAFQSMVERQLAHPKHGGGWRRNAARTPGGRNIPAALVEDFHRVVVMYGESMPESAATACRSKHIARVPVYWTAERLATGERFACAIEPPAPLSAKLLNHFELAAAHFQSALSLAAARAAWQAFQRPDDIPVVYNASTARQLATLSGRHIPCLILKSVDFNPERSYGTLDEAIAGENLTVPPANHPGRAGRRLASIAALIEHLRAMKSCSA